MDRLAPPKNVEAEMCVIGSCVAMPDLINEASEFLRPEDFYHGAHSALFRTMLNLQAKGIPCDLVNVSNAIADAGLTDLVGGAGYIARCADVPPSVSNLSYYAEIVKSTALRRALISFAETVDRSARDTERPALEVQNALEAELMDIGSDRSIPRFDLTATVDEAHRRLIDGSTGMPLHIRALSHVTMADGLVTLILAYRGMGKSRFMFGEIRHKCQQGIPCLHISLEMSQLQVIHALEAIEVGIPLFELQTEINRNPSWLSAYTRAASDIKAWPLTIDDRTGRDVAGIAATCRRWKRSHPSGLILIDYAQCINAKGRDSVERLNSVALGIQEMARHIGVPVLLAAQLTITNYDGPLGGPEAHVKGSKTFEEMSENVLILNRPTKRLKPEDLHFAEWEGKAQVNVTKNRNGIREGMSVVGWRERVGCFCDLLDTHPGQVTITQPALPVYEGEPEYEDDISYGDPFAEEEANQ